MAGLEDLAGVPNLSTVIERIDNAATKAAMLFRMIGTTYGPRRDVPRLDDIDRALRRLVVEAADECFRYQQQAQITKSDRVVVEVDGNAADDTFEVDVHCDATGNLSVEVFLKLV